MRAVSTSPRRRLLAVAAAGLLLAGAGTAAIAAVLRSPDVRVARVVDGETLAVRVGDEERLVVLAGVDAPGLGDGEQDRPCLGDRAHRFVADLVPPGTVVELRGGTAPADDEARESAAVFVGDVMVNAEVVREGLAVPVPGAGDAVDETLAVAALEGRRAGTGLYDAGIPCTLPARAAALEAEVMAALEQARDAGTDLAELQAAEARLEVAAREADALQQVLTGDTQQLPLTAYPTSVGAMRIMVDVCSVKIARERSGVENGIAATLAASGRSPDGSGSTGVEAPGRSGVEVADDGAGRRAGGVPEGAPGASGTAPAASARPDAGREPTGSVGGSGPVATSAPADADKGTTAPDDSGAASAPEPDRASRSLTSTSTDVVRPTGLARTEAAAEPGSAPDPSSPVPGPRSVRPSGTPDPESAAATAAAR